MSMLQRTLLPILFISAATTSGGAIAQTSSQASGQTQSPGQATGQTSGQSSGQVVGQATVQTTAPNSAITPADSRSKSTSSESARPYSPSLDLTSMDHTIPPCDDFYHYACGGWIKNNPIPEDQGSWDVYSKLTLDNEKYLRDLLEEAAKPTASRKATQQKIGDYYRSCMDEATIEKVDLNPLAGKLAALGSIRSLADLS